MAWTLVHAVVLGWAWQVLPADGVPLHFGPDGTPDRFGDRGDALTGFALAGVSAWLVHVLTTRYRPPQEV
jgi:hypothetical protein